MKLPRLDLASQGPRLAGEPRPSIASSSYRPRPTASTSSSSIALAALNSRWFDSSGSKAAGSTPHAGRSNAASNAEALDEVRHILLQTFARNPQLSRPEDRASEIDYLVGIALDKEAQTPENADAISRVVSYVNREEVLGERLALLGVDIDAAPDREALHEAQQKLANLQRVLHPGPAILEVLALRRQLDARLEEIVAAAGAPLVRQSARQDPLAPFAELLDNPATKTKVAELDGADALLAAHGPEVAEASYLVPEADGAPTYRLGKTTDNGSFSKIRDFIDDGGNVGKMRVLHLQPQRRSDPKVPIEVTPTLSLVRERRASAKAGSPLAFERAFSVVYDERAPVVKLYVPMPALGLEASYFGAGSAFFNRYPAKEVAAAMRAYIGSVNQSLLALHRDEPTAASMVHQDVKPGNVLIAEDGGVNLIDFGLADATKRVSRRGGVSGTRGYHAPESLAVLDPGSPTAPWPVTDKLDVWSLAVSTLQTFFGEQAQALPQQLLADVKYSPASLQQLAAEDRNDYHNFFARRTLYFATIQESWTHELDETDLSNLFLAEQQRTRPAKLTGDDEVAYASQFGHQLDRLRDAVMSVDKDVGQWFFRRFYRVDPRARFSSAELADALEALPPLYGSYEADREVAKRVFADAYPKARALFDKCQRRRSSGHKGPSLAQLAALPPQLPA